MNDCEFNVGGDNATPKNGKNLITGRDVAQVALATALIAVCSLICIPTAVPITLQTLAIYLVVCVLGVKKATFSIICYLSLGVIGLPVFSGMTGGIGVLAGANGGYLVGFMSLPLFAYLARKVVGRERPALFLGLGVGTLVCYLMGAARYSAVVDVSYVSALIVGALPFVGADAVKLVVSVFVGERVKAAIKGARK